MGWLLKFGKCSSAHGMLGQQKWNIAKHPKVKHPSEMVHVQFRDEGVMVHIPSLDGVGREVAVKNHVH